MEIVYSDDMEVYSRQGAATEIMATFTFIISNSLVFLFVSYFGLPSSLVYLFNAVLGFSSGLNYIHAYLQVFALFNIYIILSLDAMSIVGYPSTYMGAHSSSGQCEIPLEFPWVIRAPLGNRGYLG